MRDIIDIIKEQTTLPEPLRITDVGAMKIGVSDSWHGLVDRGFATVLGFEPQAEECARCNAESGQGHHYLPEALGDGNIWPFYQCKFGATSSFYEPNHDFIRQFHGLSDLMEVVEKSEMQTRRIDDVDEARKTDFLKLDVQGAELIILENATETLKHVSIIQTEVNFVPLYQDQPLFADVDRFIRAQGFVFHTFLGFGRRALSPLLVNNDPFAALNQMLWSDAVYTKPFGSALNGAPPVKLLKRAILFHTLFNSFDFTARAFHDYDRLAGTNLLNTYVASIADRKAA